LTAIRGIEKRPSLHPYQIHQPLRSFGGLVGSSLVQKSCFSFSGAICMNAFHLSRAVQLFAAVAFLLALTRFHSQFSGMPPTGYW